MMVHHEQVSLVPAFVDWRTPKPSALARLNARASCFRPLLSAEYDWVLGCST